MVDHRIGFGAPPLAGRVFESTVSVRLGDVTPSGRLRLDALSRLLQDVSSDDTRDAGLGDGERGAWVVRRMAVQVSRLPRLAERVDLQTWCSGVGPRWAERRTDLHGERGPAVSAAAVWVYVDPVRGAPIALSDAFQQRYAPAARRRRVSARLVHPLPPDNVERRPWPLRAVDFDVLGHLNNAVYWSPVEEWLDERGGWITAAEIEFRAGVDPGETVEIAWVVEPSGDETLLRQWWCVGGRIRASTLVELAKRRP